MPSRYLLLKWYHVVPQEQLDLSVTPELASRAKRALLEVLIEHELKQGLYNPSPITLTLTLTRC
eukprot:scaffold126783_cov54-Phaeocystis_antarctica.AAC.2